MSTESKAQKSVTHKFNGLFHRSVWMDGKLLSSSYVDDGVDVTVVTIKGFKQAIRVLLGGVRVKFGFVATPGIAKLAARMQTRREDFKKFRDRMDEAEKTDAKGQR